MNFFVSEEALGGEGMSRRALRAEIAALTDKLDAEEERRDALLAVLSHDPRPSYQSDPERVYGMEFSGLEVHFVVDGAVLTVTGITRR